MAKMFLNNININKAENGVIVRLSLESAGIGEKIEFDSEEHVFEDDAEASTFVSEKVSALIKTGKS